MHNIMPSIPTATPVWSFSAIQVSNWLQVRREVSQRTLLCAYTTDPRSFQVPPRRSMRTMRKICRKRMLLSADAAKMLPWLPAETTATDAISTMMSEREKRGRERKF